MYTACMSQKSRKRREKEKTNIQSGRWVLVRRIAPWRLVALLVPHLSFDRGDGEGNRWGCRCGVRKITESNEFISWSYSECVSYVLYIE